MQRNGEIGTACRHGWKVSNPLRPVGLFTRNVHRLTGSLLCVFWLSGFHTYCQSTIALASVAGCETWSTDATRGGSFNQSAHPSSSCSSWQTVPLPSMVCR